MPPELAQWIPPAVIVGVMLYLHRMTRQDMSRMEGRLREDMKNLHGEVADLREHVDTQLGSLRDRMDSQNGDLRDRMGRIEVALDVLLKFFVRPSRSQIEPMPGPSTRSGPSQEEDWTRRQARHN